MLKPFARTLSKEMREAVKNSGNHATEEANRKITTKNSKHVKQENKKETTPKTTGEKNTSSSTTGGGSVSAPTGTAPAAGSSAISTGPTGAGGAGSSAIEEKGWPRLTVTQNAKNFLHQNAGKMKVIGKTKEFIPKAREASRPLSGVKARWKLRDETKSGDALTMFAVRIVLSCH